MLDHSRLGAKELTHALYEEAQSERNKSKEWEDAGRLIEFLRSRQYASDWPGSYPRPVTNRFWSMFWEEVALLTDLRLYTGAVRANRPRDPVWTKAASALTSALRGWWLSTSADVALTSIVEYAMLSTGYGYLGYNASGRRGTGDFELKALGMDRCLPVQPGDSIQDSEAVIIEDYRSLRWFRAKYGDRARQINTGEKPEAKFGAPSSGGQPQGLQVSGAGSSPAGNILGVMETQRRDTSSGGRSQAVPGATYREYWIEDDLVNDSGEVLVIGDPESMYCYAVMDQERVYPRKRLIITGGDAILNDEGSPYVDGLYPVEALRLNPVPWQWLGYSEARPWAAIQQTINELESLLIRSVRKQLRPSLLYSSRSIDQQTAMNINNELPDQTVEYKPNAPTPPRWQIYPPAPGYLIQLITLLGREMDRTSGVGAAQQALSKPQVPGGEAFDKMRFAQSTPLRLKERAIEAFLRSAAVLAISRVCQFWTSEKLFLSGADRAEEVLWHPEALLDLRDGHEEEAAERKAKIIESLAHTQGYRQDIAEGVALSDARSWRLSNLVREFGFHIKEGSVLDLNRTVRATVALRLRMMRDLDRKTLFRQLDTDVDPAEVERNLEAELQRAKQLGLVEGPQQRVSKSSHQQGQGRVVPELPKQS